MTRRDLLAHIRTLDCLISLADWSVVCMRCDPLLARKAREARDEAMALAGLSIGVYPKATSGPSAEARQDGVVSDVD